tara:strand:+ start:2279 stop:3403 length:1125 start_codon:yes stop_codon:yes gene_type:complete
MNYLFKKYLKTKGLHQYGKIFKNFDDKKFNYFIVIPCFNEFDFIDNTLFSISKQNKALLDKTLLIIVINNSNNDSHLIFKNNLNTYNKLINNQYNINLLLIDAFSDGFAIPDKNAGVGFARKIGLDHSLKYYKDNSSILCLLDADTIVNENYLEVINNFYKPDINAAVINFKHQKSKNKIIEEGIRKYENTIKNIANKISKTGSPYGYVSMGSTITCNIRTYISVGGMNTKKATEDFYFLQAIAKYTKVHKIKDCLVHPSSRNENRVYLGTGFRINEYIKSKTFKNLNFSNSSYKSIQKIISLTSNNWKTDSKEFFKLLKSKIDDDSYNFLINHNFMKRWENFKKNTKSKQQFLLFFHQWFDALKIMKLLKKLG